MENVKFTLFHLAEIVCGAALSILGYFWGCRHYGNAAGIVSAIIGFLIGLFCGRVPGWLSEQWLVHSIQRKTSEQLRQMLREDYSGISHLLLAELTVRKEKLNEDEVRS